MLHVRLSYVYQSTYLITYDQNLVVQRNVPIEDDKRLILVVVSLSISAAFSPVTSFRRLKYKYLQNFRRRHHPISDEVFVNAGLSLSSIVDEKHCGGSESAS